MKREILYLIVEKAVVGNGVDGENLQEVSDELKGPFKDDSGFHFLISREGELMADRQLQRPADAATFYNAEGIAIGYVAARDESGATQKISPQQRKTLSVVLKVLQRVFPKASVKSKLTLEPVDG